ncbi:RNA-directed DNA polymerase [Candidatus Vecturithrix granuli]|uniref:RNA-directed DNA polymerase n=1 Tax=Vecturithrix granuli TaxID=1499967 RepID=A0A081BW60_VECG1|nr:RNA-directed DNA polymerase [Candidatus Vecturithrix granuli]
MLKPKNYIRCYSKLPSQCYEDDNYKSVKYIRYADDTLFGVLGTKHDAEEINEEIKVFLKKELKLELSELKTLITHASDGRARFLNYEITVVKDDVKKANVVVEGLRTRRRTMKGTIKFFAPRDVTRKWKEKVTKDKRVMHRTELINHSDYDIIGHYETQLQGLINYYTLALNVSKEMYKLRDLFKTSLVKTLARKHKIGATQILRKYTQYTTDGRKVITIVIPRDGKEPLRAIFGKKPIHYKNTVEIHDELPRAKWTRNELLTRMLGERCELCKAEGVRIVGHHIRQLNDLKKKYRGKGEPPKWVETMIAMRRKTLFVCDECHKKIHTGTYDGEKLT